MLARAAIVAAAFLRFLAACLQPRPARDAGWALAILAACTAGHFGWLHAPQAMQGRVWSASQALLIAFLLLAAARRYDWTVRVVAVVAATWQLLTAGCAIAYLWRPFSGECTGSLDYPLGLMALAASVGLAWLFYVGGRNRAA